MIDIRISGCCVHLSRDEGWQLRMWLGERAPFVRNQLMKIQHGGGGAVTLSTPEERREVLDALSSGGQSRNTLTGGLCSLEAALADVDNRLREP